MTNGNKSNLAIIKENLLSKAAVKMFTDFLPNTIESEALQIAKRFSRMAFNTVCQSPELQKCSFKSVIRAAAMAASLDLTIDQRGLAYLVPYRNSKMNTYEAHFQIGYLGLMELAYRSGKVRSISAHCVYESELPNVTIKRTNGRFHVEHPFSVEAPTGKIVLVYACAEIEGIGAQTMVLRSDEVEYFRSKSKAPDSPAWKNFYDAMAKKTAIRQLAKFLPKAIAEDFSRGVAIDERESYAESVEQARSAIEADTGSQMIDAVFKNEQTPQKNEAEGKGKKTKTRKSRTRKRETQWRCAKGHIFDAPITKSGTALCPKCLTADIKKIEDDIETRNDEPDFMKD